MTSPYRSDPEAYTPPPEPPFDLVAHRTISWLGGAFYLLGALGLVVGCALVALSGTSVLVHAFEERPALTGTPFVVVALTVLALVLANGARVVATDVWAGRHLWRCRAACVVAIVVAGPFGWLLGASGLVVLARPRFRKLFTS